MASRAIAAGATARPSGWILDSRRDLLLVVATPLAILPLAALVQLRLSIDEMAMYVAAFGALGHHLPGMMRAYGDRELFERFKVRFVVAPIFLVAVCIGFSQADLNGLAVVTLIWGVWHGLAQVYGFARIYDAKAGTVERFTAELDKLLCIAWFGAGVLFSTGRLGNLLEVFYQCGGPVIPPGAIHGFQTAWAAGTGILTAGFLANFALRRLRGRPQSGIKPLLLFSSFAFWWYAMVGIENVILGIAMFEIFHDVQYLTITWVYNRRLVARGHSMGPLSRFLFRPSGLLVGLYVGLVLVYGSLAIASENLAESPFQRALLGAIVASGFLHFYYDGFIWKVREKSIRDGLDVEGGAKAIQAHTAIPGWLVHGAKWSIFAVPLLWLGVAEVKGFGVSKVERYQAIVATVPEEVGARVKLGIALTGERRMDEAMARYREALELDPGRVDAHVRLADVHRERGDWPAAIEGYQRAIALRETPEAHNNLGLVYQHQGRFELAASAFERAAALGLEASHLVNLGNVRLDQGRVGDARGLYWRAVQAFPDTAEAHHNLGILMQHEGDLAGAERHLAEAARLRPRDPRVRRNLNELEAELRAREDRREQIERTIREAGSK